MSFITLLYTIIICPIELLFEVIFYLANSIVSNAGYSIAALSIAVNFIVLPLYMRADAMQAEEREKEKKLQYWVDHIKRTFKGDERFMMLQTYYRQNDYKPSYVFKSMLPLMLQIPFFIAAYKFLSQVKILQGFSFGPVKDLGVPDGMLAIFGVTINLLPILMTLINILSGMIYTQGSTVKEKLQIYGVAVLFLVLLYNSPSGLVLYWTLNNVFSLIKGLFYKMKDPKSVLFRMASCLGLIIIGFGLGRSTFSMRQRCFLILCGIILQIPVIATGYLGRHPLKVREESNRAIFILSAVYLSLLTGGLIPSAVIESSTAEFIDILNLYDPINYIVFSFALAAGTFIVWIGVYYALASRRSRVYFEYVSWVVSVIFTVDYMFFGTDNGILSATLQYNNAPSYSAYQYLINIFVTILILVAGYVLFRKFTGVVLSVLASGVIICTGMIGYNAHNIVKDYDTVSRAAEYIDKKPTIRLSKDKENVVVLMLDRMVGYYIPFMMEEDPSLYEAFDGFTFYPNTVGYGSSTNASAPSLFGGYEYTPKKMNEREDELLVDKHNEALKVMPDLFYKNDYDVTVFDVPYANYSHVPDLSIYDEYPDMKKYVTRGAYLDIRVASDDIDPLTDNMKRNFFCYGIFKSAPLVLQQTLYNGGNYNAVEKYDLLPDEWNSVQLRDGLFKASGLDATFMGAYSVLNNMGNMTEITEDGRGSFLMMDNDTAHSQMMLELPDYVPSESIDNTKFGPEQLIKTRADGEEIECENIKQVMHYHINMAAMKCLAQWFDKLRELGVYDNTRIIIVSDHAYGLEHYKEFLIDGYNEEGEKGNFDCLWFNNALLVKDFNAKGFHVDDRFMTGADVPTLALKDVIKEPVNPFTGNRIDDEAMKETDPELMVVVNWHIEENNGYKFEEAPYYTVKDNVFNPKNWRFLGRY